MKPILTLIGLASCSTLTWGKLPEFPLTWRNMTIQAGYYTSSGRYNGGIPKAGDVFEETGQCLDVIVATNASAAPVACQEWTYKRKGESVEGTCSCDNVRDEMYCDEWACERIYDPETLMEFRTCNCMDMSESGRYCQGWSCGESTSQGKYVAEVHTCVREAESGDYCEAWTMTASGDEVIAQATCECSEVTEDGSRVCASWNCEEYGVGTCSTSGTGWCDVGLAVGVGGGVGFLGLVMCCSGWLSRYQGNSGATPICIGFVWCCGWAAGVVIWGGVKGATDVGLMWGIPLVLILCITGKRKSPEVQDRIAKEKVIKKKHAEEARVAKLAAKKEAKEMKLAEKAKQLADKQAAKQKKAEDKAQRKLDKRAGKKATSQGSLKVEAEGQHADSVSTPYTDEEIGESGVPEVKEEVPVAR